MGLHASSSGLPVDHPVERRHPVGIKQRIGSVWSRYWGELPSHFILPLHYADAHEGDLLARLEGILGERETLRDLSSRYKLAHNTREKAEGLSSRT